MLDHRALLSDPDTVLAGLHRRGIDPSLVAELQTHAQRRRESIHRLEALRQELNVASAAVQQRAKSGDKAGLEETRSRLKGLKADIKAAEEEQATAENDLNSLLLNVPNLPQPSVPDGKSEADNREERRVGTPPALTFPAKSHWELGEALGIIDFEAASKISGARFAVLRGDGARLERALINFMLDVARDNGYTEVWPPLLVRPEAMLGTGQYPKFEGESFETQGREYVLIPTSEVPLVNLHREEIIEQATLPLRYTAYTPCFRREAGAAGRDTRGLIRQHQFNKVELVAFTTPEASNDELERLVDNAEEVLRRLELAYRVVSLCTGDLGFAASKTYDIEVWLPGQDTYREISSCSNCTDFQARRAQIRYRPSGDGKAKPRLLHTLNGSGLAVGRTMVAILENYQQEDGSVRIPKALVPYFGAERISR